MQPNPLTAHNETDQADAVVSVRGTSEEAAVGRGMIDLTGQRFGRLRVMDFAGMGGARRMWRRVCDCGTQTAVSSEGHGSPELIA
jgi:hypothetical protein